MDSLINIVERAGFETLKAGITGVVINANEVIYCFKGILILC
jgi:hypothetical protein